MKRILSPSLNPTGLGASVAAVYAAVIMVWHVAHHTGVIDPQVLIGGAAAIWLFYTRFVVTPVADPKDGDGHLLVHVVPPAQPSNVTVTGTIAGPPPPANS